MSASRAQRLLTGAFVLILALTAWVQDDAWITFRTLDNALAGHGLSWNPPLRVQTFTHPLWLAVQTPAYLLLGTPRAATMRPARP